MSECDVAIIGAGPYGLSIAAHLVSRHAEVRVLGVPMQNWRQAMPSGMFLKSDGAGTNLSAAENNLTLAEYCAAEGVPYGDHATPISLRTFLDYARAFQRRFVPEVVECAVISLAGKSGRFELRLETGEYLKARKVVVAVGTTFFGYMPEQLLGLPRELVTHSRDHSDFSQFTRRDVIVIGGGQSALETGALLNEHGAGVQLLVRKPSLEWNPSPSVSTRPPRLGPPHSALGRDWRAWFYCRAPGVFYYFPPKLRTTIVHRTLGPAGAWWLRSRVLGRINMQCGCKVREAREVGARIRLTVDGAHGRTAELSADHVIAATGYKVDIDSLPFLDSDLLKRLRREGGAPRLSPNFEASVPGLYFAGLASAAQFGPAMRFVFGAEYTARRIAQSLRPTGRSAHASEIGIGRPVGDYVAPARK